MWKGETHLDSSQLLDVSLIKLLKLHCPEGYTRLG